LVTQPAQAAGIDRTSTRAGLQPIHFRGDVRVIITGPNGIERRAAFSG
jgi:hypothetical protein